MLRRVLIGLSLAVGSFASFSAPASAFCGWNGCARYNYYAPTYYYVPAPAYAYYPPAPAYSYYAPAPAYGYYPAAPAYGYYPPVQAYGYAPPVPAYRYQRAYYRPVYGYRW
jgi:hypothetical protein